MTISLIKNYHKCILLWFKNDNLYVYKDIIDFS